MPGLITLSASDRRSLLKVHPGALPYINTMANLASADARLQVAKVNPQTTLSDLAPVTGLDTVLDALKAVTQTVTDTKGSLLADAYTQTLAIYAVAQALARDDAVLANEIQGLANFLRPRTPRKKRTPAVTAPPSSGSAASPPASPPATATIPPATPAPVMAVTQRRVAERRQHHRAA